LQVKSNFGLWGVELSVQLDGLIARNLAGEDQLTTSGVRRTTQGLALGCRSVFIRKPLVLCLI
jgi:hypothetical protein